MIKNGKPIRLNRYRGKERCPIESGMKREWQKKGGGEERGMIDFRQRNNRFGQLIDGRLLERSFLRSWAVINFFEFKKKSDIIILCYGLSRTV